MRRNIRCIDFNTITDEEWMELGEFHSKDLVTVLRNTNLPLSRYEQLINMWGRNKSLSQFGLMKKYNKNHTKPWQIRLSKKEHRNIVAIKYLIDKQNNLSIKRQKLLL